MDNFKGKSKKYAFILAILITGILVLFVADKKFGYPFGYLIERIRITQHLHKTYPNIKFNIGEISYNFLQSNYYTKVTAEINSPLSFDVYDFNGKDIEDSFVKTLIKNRGLTIDNLSITLVHDNNKIKHSNETFYDYKIEWYDNNITKGEFLKRSLTIYNTLKASQIPIKGADISMKYILRQEHSDELKRMVSDVVEYNISLSDLNVNSSEDILIKDIKTQNITE